MVWFPTLRFARQLVLILTVLLLGEFASITFIPKPVVAKADVVYGEADELRQSMDIYYPRDAKKVKGPVNAFLFIHGGSWIAGRKEDDTMFAAPLAKEGFVTASMNYRFIPRRDEETGEITRPGSTVAEIMEDIGLAIAKLKETAEADGIEIASIALLGDSAGGHLALLYAYTHLNGTENAPALPIAFVIGRVAPTNVGVWSIFDEDDSMDINVLGHVSADVPPTILCYSTNDELVKPQLHGFPLRDLLIEYEIPFEFITFNYSGHTMLDPRDIGRHNDAYRAFFAYAKKYF